MEKHTILPDHLKKEERIVINTAEPPPEVCKIIAEQRLPAEAIEGWLAVPSVRTETHRVKQSEVQENQVDIYEALQPMLGKPVLEQTLRTMDVMDGCGHNCDTCLADAALPSKMISLDSLKRLFFDERFIQMLQPDSLRFGSSGDLLEHPDAIAIVELALESTKPLEVLREMSKPPSHHQIKVFTNYRPIYEEKLNALIDLAKKFPDRLEVVISLPLNAKDVANDKFDQFALTRPDVFGEYVTKSDDGLVNYAKRREYSKNVLIHDVRHGLVFDNGRKLSGEVLRDKDVKLTQNEGRLEEKDFGLRGSAKTYLNADGLWLMMYGTHFESHTKRIFTPLTPGNVSALSHVPYHPDFPRPKNWPGGTAVFKDYAEIAKLQENAAKMKKGRKRLTVVD